MQFKDYYETLGVGRDATGEEVKKAFRKLARKGHTGQSLGPSPEFGQSDSSSVLGGDRFSDSDCLLSANSLPIRNSGAQVVDKMIDFNLHTTCRA